MLTLPSKKTVIIASVAALAGLGVGASRPATPTTPTVAAVPAAVAAPSCVKALDSADRLMGNSSQGFGIAGEVIGMMPGALEAAWMRDNATLERLAKQIGERNARLSGLVDKVTAEQGVYAEAAAGCRAAR